jgi:hypothetical protein
VPDTDEARLGPRLVASDQTTALFSPVGSQFSLTRVITITLAAGASFTGFNSDSLVHAPEPGTLVSAGIGLAALAIGVRLRNRRAADESTSVST